MVPLTATIQRLRSSFRQRKLSGPRSITSPLKPANPARIKTVLAKFSHQHRDASVDIPNHPNVAPLRTVDSLIDIAVSSHVASRVQGYPVIILAMMAKSPDDRAGVWYGLWRMQHAIRRVLPRMASHSPHKRDRIRFLYSVQWKWLWERAVR